MLSKNKVKELLDFAILNYGEIHNLTEKTIWIEFKQISDLTISKKEISFSHIVDGKLLGAFLKADWGDAKISVVCYKNELNLHIKFKKRVK